MRNRVPLNKEAYSDESKQSIGWEYLGKEYRDISYTCKKCKNKAIFTAREQKEYFEVQKKYMWTKRTLCSVCWKEIKQIKSELASLEQRYIERKLELKSDRKFLLRWLQLLLEYPKYGKPKNSSKIASIEKALSEATDT
ncbi:zinc-ribbon domain containing protein [Microbulbifer taiwanensis]|uniref:Zinc-ribbon domain containing protein n=1 Tax=Microbulbifer taiwanensis TaxID=986746 RepID=A0ABW1YLN0_9GAMM|nr:zinc-ribbon domain containing protein [Microbulbifer taiwanensis]